MTEKQLKGYVLRLFKFKTISPRQFMIAKSNLEQIKEGDPLFYYFNMGKLHTSFGNVDEAIEYLTRAVALKPDHSSAYYNLYKCFVKKGNADTASSCFNEFLRNNQADVDFSFPIQIMRAIKSIDKDFFDYLASDFSVENNNKLGYNNLGDNADLTRMYSEVISMFNDRNYIGAIGKLRRMDVYITEKSYPMEVDTVIGLIRILKEKETTCYLNALNDEKMKDVSAETYANIQLRLYELGRYNQESFLRKIEEVINEESYIKGKLLLDKISVNPDFNKYQDMIDYLRGFIREKEAFSALEEEKQAEFTSRRLKAKGLYKKKRNDESLEAYTALKEEFGLPICDYYIGKILFRQGNFSQAKEAFLSYLEQGGVKAEKAYMFLGKISKIVKEKSEASKYINMMHKIHKVFTRDFDYLSDKNYKKRKRLGLDEDMYDQHDVVKRKKSRNIRMTEADFAVDEELKVADFYDTDIDGKLIIIKGLLRNGDVRVANKLFNEVQRECLPEERGKVKQFDRNRKIYKNQKRSNQI